MPASLQPIRQKFFYEKKQSMVTEYVVLNGQAKKTGFVNSYKIICKSTVQKHKSSIVPKLYVFFYNNEPI